jgi:seryl-tRNA synthetase
MANEIKIKFPTLEKAIEFARKKNYDFEVIEPKKPKLIKKTYASNFG